MQGGEGFPFWRMTLAVALGVLIANAIMWSVGAVAAGMLLRGASEEIGRQNAAAESERRQAAAISEQRRRDQQAKERDHREGPYVQPATDRLQTGAIGCMNGTVVRREANGWTQMNGGASGPMKCRSSP